MRFSTCNIPVELCQWALANKHVRELQVFIWLKMNCSGKIKITPEVLHNITKELGLKSAKTVKSAISVLMDRKWITFSKRSGYYFIKGFESIRKKEGFKRKTAVEFSIRDIRRFKGFLVAAVISNLIAVQKKREWLSERKNGRSKTEGHLPSLFFPVANIVIAKIFKISLSTAWEWKKLAQKQRFIRVRRNSKALKVDTNLLPALRKYSDDSLSAKLRFSKGKIQEQLPDTIATNLTLKSRKKIRKGMENFRKIYKWDYKGNSKKEYTTKQSQRCEIINCHFESQCRNKKKNTYYEIKDYEYQA